MCLQVTAVAGLQAISDFIEANVPQTERSKAGEVLVRILNGVLFFWYFHFPLHL